MLLKVHEKMSTYTIHFHVVSQYMNGDEKRIVCTLFCNMKESRPLNTRWCRFLTYMGLRQVIIRNR